jgi:hypothetical protein
LHQHFNCPPTTSNCLPNVTMTKTNHFPSLTNNLKINNALRANNLHAQQATNPAAKNPRMLAIPHFQGATTRSPVYASTCIFCITPIAKKQPLNPNPPTTYIPQNAPTHFARPPCIRSTTSAPPRLRVASLPAIRPHVTTAQHTLVPPPQPAKIFY